MTHYWQNCIDVECKEACNYKSRVVHTISNALLLNWLYIWTSNLAIYILFITETQHLPRFAQRLTRIYDFNHIDYQCERRSDVDTLIHASCPPDCFGNMLSCLLVTYGVDLLSFHAIRDGSSLTFLFKSILPCASKII